MAVHAPAASVPGELGGLGGKEGRGREKELAETGQARGLAEKTVRRQIWSRESSIHQRTSN